MKKIFLSFVLLFTICIINPIKAAEVILYNQNGFEVKSDAYVTDETKHISVVKGSNLIITYTDPKATDEATADPKIDLTIANKLGQSVYSLKTPTTKTSPNDANFEQYLAANEAYTNAVKVMGDQVQITVPVNLEEGAYDISLALNSTKPNLTYSMTVSDKAYEFTQSDITIEDSSVLANIGYKSLIGKEDSNKVVVTLTQDGNEIFKNQYDKDFFTEGTISIDEKIDALTNLKGKADIKIEIVNKAGKVILSQTQTVDLKKSFDKVMYYGIVGALLVLLIVLFFVFRNKRQRMVVGTMMFILLSFFGIKTSNILAVETCGGVDKPADYCLEGKNITHVCQLTNSCSTTDPVYKKYFSTGVVTNTGQGSTRTINVCTTIGSNFPAGDFYVLADSAGSSWQRKRFHVFQFTKGTAGSWQFKPSGTKYTVNSATYDGSCSVTVKNIYAGESSDFTSALTNVIEVGTVTSDMCKAQTVTSDTFETNKSMLSLPVCSSTQLSSSYIKGSVVQAPVNALWTNKTVNMCDYLGITSADVATLGAQNKSFYALMENTASWTVIKYPIFAFPFGKASTQLKYAYAGFSKQSAPTMSYDGNCTITFKLVYGGDNTDVWYGYYKLIEMGKVDNATCRDPILVDDKSYSGAYKNNQKYQVKYQTMNGKYQTNAPFFLGLGDCQSSTSCTLKGDWIESATDDTCGVPPPTNCSCSGRTQTCVTNGATTTTANAPACSLQSSCSVSAGATNTTFTIVPLNGVGNVTYTTTYGTTTSTVTQNKSNPYTYTVPKKDGVQSISVLLKDASDNQTNTAACSIDNGNTPKLPPTVNLTKSPSISLNKNGNCSISWDIQNLPDGASCTLTGTGSNSGLPLSINDVGTWVSGPLSSSQRYTAACTGGGIDPAITVSVLCRVNPDIKEN